MKHKKHIQNFKTYCPLRYKEIENYELAEKDSFIGWHCHHKLGEHCFTKEELKKFGMYFDVTPGELIFIKSAEHGKLHNKGKSLSVEHRKHISKSEKGKNVSFETRLKISKYQKTKIFTTEYRKHLSESISKSAGKLSKEYREYRSSGGELTWNNWLHFRRSNILYSK